MSGLTVMMPDACPKCRHGLTVIGSGAVLICMKCRRPRGLLSKQEADFVEKIINTFGRPTTPIVLRNETESGAANRCQPGDRSSPAPGGHHHA
jgi:hypothetical protein